MHLRQNYRLYPSESQSKTLDSWVGASRFVWNYMLGRNKNKYQLEGKFLFGYDMHLLLTQLKKNPYAEWLREAPSQVLQQKCNDLDQAIKQAITGTKSKKIPRFKSRKTDTSGIRFPQGFSVSRAHLKLPKLGDVRIALHRPLLGLTKSATISQDKAGAWFVSFVVEVDDSFIPPKVEITNEIGIDLGLKEFAITSDGELINNPRFYRESEKRLRKAQRRHSKKTRGGKNKEKARIKLARAHKRVANKSKDFVNQVAASITKTNDLICIESLNTKGMLKNHKLAKSIQDAAWGSFISALKWHAHKRGKHVVDIDRFFPSSKTCSCCGHVKEKLTLGERTFECESCGFTLDRDLNAAINILVEGKKIHTAGTAEMRSGDTTPNACGDGKSTVVDFPHESQ